MFTFPNPRHSHWSLLPSNVELTSVLGLVDPDPLLIDMDPDPDPDPSIIMQKARKTLIPTIFYFFFTFLSLKNYVNVPSEK
jgi:hypothetical protein